MPTCEISQILKQDPLDTVECFFISFQLCHHQAFERVGL